jgi:hypothetical protein
MSMNFVDGTGENIRMNDPKVRGYFKALGMLGDEYVAKTQLANMEKMQEFLHNNQLKLSEKAQQELLGWVNTMHFMGILLGKGISIE